MIENNSEKTKRSGKGLIQNKYMASIYSFENRDERIERMQKDNPGKAIELCTVVVDSMFDKKRSLIESKIPERFKNASIKDLGYNSVAVNRAISEMLKPPEENDKVGTIFCGPAGSGKTHAAYAVIHELIKQNPEMVAYMTTYSEAFSTIKNEFFNGSYDDLNSVWSKLNNTSGMFNGILFIDDISSKALTEFELDKLMMFLERRFNSFLPFILTTNVKQENFKSVFGERLASRLFGYCTIVEFLDRDKRLSVD